MERDEIALVLRTIADSLESDPSQFHYESSITGVHLAPTITGAPGGDVTVLSVSATGGGPGSQTTGMHVETSVGPVQIEALNTAQEAHQEEVIESLRVLAEAVEEPDPSDAKIRGALARLGASVAPPLIVAVATTLITHGMSGIL